MINLSKIGERVREVRKNLGLSQNELAAQLFGWDPPRNYASTISKIEAGKRLPSTGLLSGFENLYASMDGERIMRISVDYILFGRPNILVEQLCSFPIYNDSVKCHSFFIECEKAAELIPEDFHIDADAPYSECAYRLQQIRKERGLNQGDFGLDKSCVCRNERTEDPINTRYLLNFCGKMGVSADYILFGYYPMLPKLLQSLIIERRYSTQVELLRCFIKIGQKIFGS